MGKYKVRAEEVEAFSYDEFTKLGRTVSGVSVDDVPVRFTFGWRPVRRDKDGSYFVTTFHGVLKMGPGEVILRRSDDEIFVVSEEKFNLAFEPA